MMFALATNKLPWLVAVQALRGPTRGPLNTPDYSFSVHELPRSWTVFSRMVVLLLPLMLDETVDQARED